MVVVLKKSENCKKKVFKEKLWRNFNKNMQMFRVKIILMFLKICMCFILWPAFVVNADEKKPKLNTAFEVHVFEVNFESMNLSKSWT